MSKTFGPYASAKAAGDLVFIAGQVGVDPATKVASSVFSDQFKQVLANLTTVLEESDLSPQNIVNVRVYLTDMSTFSEMNELYAAYFDGIAPSRECVGVASLPAVAGETKLLVELSAVAKKA